MSSSIKDQNINLVQEPHDCRVTESLHVIKTTMDDDDLSCEYEADCDYRRKSLHLCHGCCQLSCHCCALEALFYGDIIAIPYRSSRDHHHLYMYVVLYPRHRKILQPRCDRHSYSPIPIDRSQQRANTVCGALSYLNDAHQPKDRRGKTPNRIPLDFYLAFTFLCGTLLFTPDCSSRFCH